MSAFPVPEGSVIVVTIFRAASSSPGIGTCRLIAQSPLSAPCVAEELASRLPFLFADAGLPAQLHPGPPLSMLLQVMLPTGQLVAHAASANLLRAAPLTDMIAAWKRDLPEIVAATFAGVARKLETQPRLATVRTAAVH